MTGRAAGPGPEPGPARGTLLCPYCRTRLLLNSGPHCPRCGWRNRPASLAADVGGRLAAAGITPDDPALRFIRWWNGSAYDRAQEKAR